ncbi:MAG: hypothetical protein N2508_03675 [Anaerolineae bacterium]|nr:hypothetical protein [Anaerolineae bacterium]
MTWPLVLRIDDSVVGWVGDNFYFVWLIGWVQKSLYVLENPLEVPILNYPEGWNLAYNEMTPAMVLIAIPASIIGGPVLGYNFSIFVSFVLSGLGMYLWVRRITGNVLAGSIAGMIFAFAPYRLCHLLGHLNLMGTQWLPYFFMGLGELLRNRSWSWRRVLATACFLGLIGLTSQYYLYMTVVLSAFYVLGYVFISRKYLIPSSDFWIRTVSFVIISLPFALIPIIPYLQLSAQGNLTQRSFEEVRVWSASPLDFILPSPKHFLWGQWIDSRFDRSLWVENTLYVGTVTLILSFLSFVRFASKSYLERDSVRLCSFVTLIAFVLALGTDLRIGGRSVTISVPEFLQRWYPHEQTFVPLPGYFLFKYLPFYANMRVWMRYGIFVIMFMSVLAGIGTAGLIEKPGTRSARWVMFGGIALLILVDFFQGPQMLSEVRGRPVDIWLASQDGEEAVAQFPIGVATRPEHTFFTLVHGKPFIGGFFAAYSPPQFQRIRAALGAFPDINSVALLRELGVRWVIVDTRQYQDYMRVHSAIESMGLRFRTGLDEQYVYELTGAWHIDTDLR